MIMVNLYVKKLNLKNLKIDLVQHFVYKILVIFGELKDNKNLFKTSSIKSTLIDFSLLVMIQVLTQDLNLKQVKINMFK